MSQSTRQRILAINVGSSSLKISRYRLDNGLHLDLTASAERIGRSGSRVRIATGDGTSILDRSEPLSSHPAALSTILDAIQPSDSRNDIVAVGHRVVHGGRLYSQPQPITDTVVADLGNLIPLDPDHLPQTIAVIAAARHHLPHIPHIACFDTAFHATMPPVARRYPLPRRFVDQGVVRYGFHGLSYESIVHELRERGPLPSRLVVAHLGSGASMAAIRDGQSVETTMGFTPTGGLMMGTRTGDIDPGVLLYLLQHESLGAGAVSDLVNHGSGLLGVSGRSADIRDLLGRMPDDTDAAAAVELFCYTARKAIGSLAAVLGGLDELVFTGGIGEHAAAVREEICAGLGFLDIRIDPDRNTANAPTISRDDASVPVRVIRSDENRMIARHTRRLTQGALYDVRV